LKPIAKIRIGIVTAIVWGAVAVCCNIAAICRSDIDPFNFGDMKLLTKYNYILFTLFILGFYVFGLAKKSLTISTVAYCVWITPFIFLVIGLYVSQFYDGYMALSLTGKNIIAVVFYGLLLWLLALGIRGLAQTVKVDKKPKEKEKE
jgi:hypothetical protein